jgi:hypothetical protein
MVSLLSNSGPNFNSSGTNKVKVYYETQRTRHSFTE